MNDKKIGSSFDSFLEEEGIYEVVEAAALKRAIAFQLERAMTEGNVTKAEMARRMNTSRSQLDRLLDPEKPQVQLDTVMKAATVLGKKIRVEFVDAGEKAA